MICKGASCTSKWVTHIANNVHKIRLYEFQSQEENIVACLCFDQIQIHVMFCRTWLDHCNKFRRYIIGPECWYLPCTCHKDTCSICKSQQYCTFNSGHFWSLEIVDSETVSSSLAGMLVYTIWGPFLSWHVVLWKIKVVFIENTWSHDAKLVISCDWWQPNRVDTDNTTHFSACLLLHRGRTRIHWKVNKSTPALVLLWKTGNPDNLHTPTHFSSTQSLHCWQPMHNLCF